MTAVAEESKSDQQELLDRLDRIIELLEAILVYQRVAHGP